MGLFATACRWVGRHQDAITLNQQILESRKARLGPDHPETLVCVFELAGDYQFVGQWATSGRLLEQLLEKQRNICGPMHPATLDTMHWLAMNYGGVDRFAESLALHEQVLEVRKSALGPEHESTTWCMLTFAQVCQRTGRLEQAERLLRGALEQTRKRDDSLGRRQGTANALGWLARNLLLQEQYTAAEPLAREAVAIFARQPPEDSRRFYWVSLLGAVLLGQQRYAEAEPLLLQGYEGMKQREAALPANERRRLTEAGERVVRFYEVTNQTEKARLWREKLQASSHPE
jgi:tetratricopeptide (TPR) repeat protein